MIRALLLLLAAVVSLSGPASAGDTADAGEQRVLVMLRLPPQHFRPDADYGGGYGDSATRASLMRQARRIARLHHLAVVDDWPMPLIDVDCVVMRLPASATVDGVIAELASEPGVRWSQPLHEYRALTAKPVRAGDPLYAAQPARALWHLDALHRLATGRGTVVAVVDSGIDTRHPDLSGQISGNLNFVSGKALVPERHGTAVAGIIAAKAGNREGIVGVAPGARVIGLRACWQGSAGGAAVCDSLSLAKALHFAVEHRVPIVNLSLTGPPDRLLAELIGIGIGRDMAVVAAYDPARSDGGFPASLKGVIAVSDKPVSGGARKVYVAPAHGVPVPEPGGAWGLVDGTSYAAAHVSGLVALARQRTHGPAGSPVLVTRGSQGTIDALATVEAGWIACHAPCPRSSANVAGS